MKNIDLTKLTKVELINEIINLTNKCNECIRLRGYLNTHKVLSANTLRTKSREFLEKQFEQAWGWLYEEVRANYSVLPINIDKQALDTIKAKSENATEENFKEYRASIDEIILPYVNGVALGLVKVNPFFKLLMSKFFILCSFPIMFRYI